MKYKAILYDLDGTLLDTADMNIVTLQRIIREELGVERSCAELRYSFAQPGMKTIRDLGVADVEGVYARWVRYVNEFPHPAAPYPGAVEALAELHARGVLQGVVSSKKRRQYEIDFIAQGLDRYMSAAVLEEDTPNHKPDPEPLILCLERLGATADEALYVGDTPSDCLAAHAAGMDFAFAGWGITPAEEIPSAEWILRRPEELLKL